MRKRTWWIWGILLLAAAGMWVWAVGSRDKGQDEEKDSIRLGILLYRGDDTFISNVRQALEEQAKLYEQENQIKAIRSFIEMGVDVIAFPPVVETGWEAVLTECQEAGIPVILVDRGIAANTDEDENLYTTMIASDHVWAGEQAAIAMNDLLGGSGVVVELEGTVGASAAVQRKQGFDEYMAANCSGIEIVASQTGDFTRAQGKEVMESFLKTYDKIDGVFCHNDDMALGAIEAIKEAGPQAR